ncbi:MAG: 4Fe-4S dicluster domain-containing protein [Bacteroidetes bacterium]|jgi:heterodisulfide reductase subunit C|nr:4Fe-4S dicluster domain-containing protein [Bacteroidota bacterium]
MTQQIIFLAVLLIVGFFAYRKYSQLIQNINLGKADKPQGPKAPRWKNVLLVAFGQKKMFKNWIPAIFHLFIYVAFLFTQIELIEILIDGIGGVHRFFADKLSFFYPIIINTIEILSLLAFVATFIFLIRRNLLYIPRFKKPEMKGWPKLDANLILLGELLLIIGIFTMNGTDVILQERDPAHYSEAGPFYLSQFIGPLIFDGFSTETLVVLERTGWWLHFLMVMAFLLYLPYSKHLHILLAFPNTYYSRQKNRGKMSDMPEITAEIKSMLGLSNEDIPMTEEIPEFGAKDVQDLSWRALLGAYACTECGRCTEQCPANMTGKKLSPRKIVMDIRDRAEEVGDKIRSGDSRYIKNGSGEKGDKLTKENFDDGKSLFDYISSEELAACTTCNACVEACPVLINPLEPILEMRRYEILTESSGPKDWAPMFTSMENSGAVWQVPDERADWAKDS